MHNKGELQVMLKPKLINLTSRSINIITDAKCLVSSEGLLTEKGAISNKSLLMNKSYRSVK